MQSICVTRSFAVEPLLDIHNAEFAHWYELGVWWAMYGEEQGKGPELARLLQQHLQPASSIGDPSA